MSKRKPTISELMRHSRDGFFRGWDDATRDEVAKQGRLRRFTDRTQEPDRWLWRQGDASNHDIALIVDGCFRILRDDQLLDLVHAGQTIGLSALSGAPHSASVYCEEGKCIVWDARSILGALQRRPETLLGALLCSTSLVRKLNDELALYRRRGSATNTRKVAWHLVELTRHSRETEPVVPYGLKRLSERSGLFLSTVSASVGDLRAVRILAPERKKELLIIEDLERLKRVARGELHVPRHRPGPPERGPGEST